MENDNCIFDVMNKVLSSWTTPIDISDGDLLIDKGFYSYNLTNSHWNVDGQFPVGTNFSFMTWAVYGVLHKQARKNFIDENYMIDVMDLNRQEILDEYKTVLIEADEL